MSMTACTAGKNCSCIHVHYLQDLETCLRASANVPEVAGRPIQHRGRRLVDAAVFEPVPFRAAIADGCTHLITLCSRPPFECAALPPLYHPPAARLAGIQATK